MKVLVKEITLSKHSIYFDYLKRLPLRNKVTINCKVCLAVTASMLCLS